MKIILLGSNGMLGTYLNKYLGSKYVVIPLTRKEIDIASAEESAILKILRDNTSQDDIIINACGVIKQREYNVIDMIKVNSVFPHILAKLKNEIGCEVIHITTDCVFNGLKGSYSESDNHDCIDDYGKSKSLGENPTITNIRTSIIGEEKYNKKSLLEWVISNKNNTISGFDNHLWNGVTCLELAIFIGEMIKGNLFWESIRHIHSPNTVSKYDLVNMINDIYDLNITINKKSTEINCYRNLTSDKNNPIYKTLSEQILEQKNFKI